MKGKCIGVLLLAYLYVPCLATYYAVGDASGWTLGVDYTTWSSSKTFLVGDSLVFNYRGEHTVGEVISRREYLSCSDADAISKDSSGSTSILLKTPGPHFFISGVGDDCANGMRLSVIVDAASGGSSSL